MLPLPLMLEIPASFHRRPRSLEWVGGLERPEAPQEQPADDCWRIMLSLRLLRSGEVPVQRAQDWAAKELALERLSMPDQG